MSGPRDNSQDKVAQVLTRALRDLPPRPAPDSLQRRVYDALQRRAARPWWRSSFTQWPVLARCAWVAVCAALIGVTLLDGPWNLITWAARLARFVGHLVPPLWLNIGLGLGALLYLTLFGVGATAYRTLYLQPSNSRSMQP
jgi:hypothetical protein